MVAFIFWLVMWGGNSLTGWLIVRRFGRFSAPFTLLLSAVLGTAINGWWAVFLAEIGYFRPIVLLLLFLVLNGGLALWSLRVPISWPIVSPKLTPPFWLIGGWLPVAVWLFGRPHQFIQGGADAGVYINLAANIARTGRILIQDSTLAQFSPALYPAFFRQLGVGFHAAYNYLPGFFIEHVGTGQITPQFYPLHPVWLAVAHLFGGVQATLLLNGYWAILSSVMIFAIGQAIGGWRLGALTLVGLSLNALQLWFGRYPTTEPLTQLWFWTAILSLFYWFRDENSPRLWPLLAGLALGNALLTRIDTFFLIVIPFAILFVHGFIRPLPHQRWFHLPFFALALHTFAHAWWQSRPYFLETFDGAIDWLIYDWYVLVGVALLALIGLVGLLRGKAWWVKFGRYRSYFLAILIIAILSLTIYAWFIRPMARPIFYIDGSGAELPIIDHQNLIRLGWYFSPLGVWLGIIGGCWLLWRLRLEIAPLLAIGFFFTALYVWHLQANPYQIYSMRRFVPVTLPFLTLTGAYALTQLLPDSIKVKKLGWPRMGAGLLLMGLWLAGLAWNARGFVSQVDNVGSSEQIAAFEANLPPYSILIFNERSAYGQGELLGTPLHFLYGHDVLTLYDLEGVDSAELSRQLTSWHEQNRTIFWVSPSNGGKWDSAEWQLSNPTPYSISLTQLEANYWQKPTQLAVNLWEGTRYELLPAQK